MLCLFFGLIVATIAWPWLGPWAAFAGLAAAMGLFGVLKVKSERDDPAD